jgi:CRISPR/Cas system-associated exonuclease Cas4 (RecB family)
VTSFVSKSGVEVSARGKIASLELHSDKWTEDGHFRWEKALEASLVSVLGTKEQEGFMAALGMPKAKIIWFANYLTYGVQGGSIDLLLLVRDGAVNKAVVIELKKGGLAPKPFRKAVAQVKAYSLYVEKAFRSFGEKIDTVPVVVSGLRNSPQQPLPGDGVMHILYRVEKGSIVYREAQS